MLPVELLKYAGAWVIRTARIPTVPTLAPVLQGQEKSIGTDQAAAFIIDRNEALGYTLTGFRRLKKDERSTTS